ncbi:hypothetical protein sscle_06g055050 [Sclerotinia sclerotiorum 1980 UF-70]|uniref:Uncharacterized protein n=1 Tax=Sclerotinia sclerotiorum (strain ATCC 18683 / 1980 / Ss-1) TaxID=665079 RepID=A0A1D9Q728_SCLS1|nr:hypothetical protein sscle_06g055050 [Sclerotinia sclerotiorum 1980 UF-70]
MNPLLTTPPAQHDQKPALRNKFWGLGDWFDGRAIKFRELKRWINKKADADSTPFPSATQTPSKEPPRIASGGPVSSEPQQRSVIAMSVPPKRSPDSFDGGL